MPAPPHPKYFCALNKNFTVLLSFESIFPFLLCTETLRRVKIELYTQWLSTLGLLMSAWLPPFFCVLVPKFLGEEHWGIIHFKATCICSLYRKAAEETNVSDVWALLTAFTRNILWQQCITKMTYVEFGIRA